MCPNIVYSRRIGQWLEFGGIGPDDCVAGSTYVTQGNETVFVLDSDGRAKVSFEVPGGDQNWSGPLSCAVDNEHFYLLNEFYGDMELSCRDLHGTEVWDRGLSTGNVIPVDGRGLAVAADNTTSNTGKVTFFDAQGNLISEGMLLGSEGRPAFNAGGIAAWAYYTWKVLEPIQCEAEWFCASELNPHGVSIHDACFPYAQGYAYPAWSSYYAKVNESGNVFVSACKKVAAFADASLETKLWECTLDGFAVWENACGDPSGGWYVVHAQPEGDDGWFRELKLLRIDPDGTAAWDKSMGQPWSSISADSVCKCDAEANVYFAFEGEVISLDPSGSERWRRGLPEEYVSVMALDSSGTVYVRGDIDPTTISYQTTLFALSDREPHHSRVRVKLLQRIQGDVYSLGDELTVLLQPYNFGEDEVVDGYLAVILPNGAMSFYTSSGWSASPTPWFPNVFLPNSFEIIDAPLSLGVIPEGAPEGTYTVIAGFTHPGTLTPVDELFPLTFQVADRCGRSAR